MYINSKENTVMKAIDAKDRVVAATYITQGQKLFTYNDIAKYFKTSQKYIESLGESDISKKYEHFFR